MKDDQPPTDQHPTMGEPPQLDHEPTEEQDWFDEGDQPEELPPRQRRRLLKPIPLALLAVLLIAGGFIGGVQVQKGEESQSGGSAGAGGSLASRFAALRGGNASSSGGGSGNTSPGGAGGAIIPGTGAGGARPTTGTVAYLAGSTLYVTTSEGNTVKVDTSPATSVTKTVKAEVKSIYPGETVAVTGATGSGGAVSAESIRAGSGAGGVSALFGGSTKNSTGAGGGGGPALFGSG